MVFALKLKRLSCFKIRSYFWFVSRYGSTNICYFPKKYKMHLNYKSVTATSYFIVFFCRLFFASNVPVRIRALCFAAAQSDWSTSLFYFQTSFTPLAFFKRTRLITRKHSKPHFNTNFHYHNFF